MTTRHTDEHESFYWERRGKQIYSEGRFDEEGGNIVGTAKLIYDFHGTNISVDDIDFIVVSHNQTIDTLTSFV